MYCPKCHKKIANNIKYCNYCGHKVSKENTHENQVKYSKKYSNASEDIKTHEDLFSYSLLYSNMYKNKVTSNEDYLKAYIGKNYEIIRKEKLSISAFIFGPFYLIYRKMWLSALLVFLLICILINYTTSEITMFIEMLIHLYLGLKINSIYMQSAERKVDEIKISNPDKSSTELLDLCKSKGGTSLLIVIISLIIILIITTELIIKTPKDKAVKISTENKIYTLDKLNYQINNNVNASNNNNNDYHHYTYTDNNSSCSFSILTNKYTNIYKTANDYLSKNITDENKYNLSTIYLGNNDWATTTIYDNSKEQKYYATIYNNKIYIIEIKINKDNQSTCKIIENNLLNSILFS